MPDVEIRPFSDEDVGPAAELLGKRHARHRAAAHALTWALGARYRSMTVDWREVNLLASRFWPRRGLRPTFLRLYRHIP